MATTKKQNNVKANNVKANNVKANESATATASATDESESNASATATASATDESESNASATATAKVENESNASKQEATTSEPTSEQIAAAKVETKHQKEIGERYALDAPKEVERTKFAGATVLGVWRVDKTQHTKKDGDKTFFKIYYRGTIYDGFTATEFCDTVGIERKHRNGNTPKVVTMLDKWQALKAAIEAIESTESDFVNFAKIVAQKIENEKLESERAGFLAKYAAAIALFAEISEATCAKIYGADVLTLAKKLGYKFSDTKETTESK